MNFNMSSNAGSSAMSGGALNLDKGGILDLTKQAPSLKNCILAGGWDASRVGPSADLDIAAFLLDEHGRVAKVPDDVIFFNNKQAHGIMLEGDNLTGNDEDEEGEDAERIDIQLDKIDDRIKKIVFFITIYNAENKGQTFGMINNSYVRLLDADKNEKEVCRYPLKERYSMDTAITVCSLNRNARGWEFEAIGDGCMADLNGLLARYR